MTKADDHLLLEAVLERDSEKVASAIERGADPNSARRSSLSALHLAATFGPPEVVEELVRGGANVNIGDDERKRTPLHSAAMSVATDADRIIELLLKGGAEVNAPDTDGYTPLDVAVACDNRNGARQLREAGGVRNPRHRGTVEILGLNKRGHERS